MCRSCALRGLGPLGEEPFDVTTGEQARTSAARHLVAGLELPFSGPSVDGGHADVEEFGYLGSGNQVDLHGSAVLQICASESTTSAQIYLSTPLRNVAHVGILACMSNAPASTGVPEWTIADRLRKAREQRGLSQQELEDASNGDLRLRTISNYEKPHYESERKRSTVRLWALATGVPFEWLWNGTVSGPSGGDSVTRWYPGDRLAEVHYLRPVAKAA